MLRSDREKLVMKGFRTKVIALMVVALSYLLLFQTSAVEAVDLIGYPGSWCSGNGIACYNIEWDECCGFNAYQNSLQSRSVLKSQTASIYTGAKCRKFLSSTTRDTCWHDWHDITGARWEATCITTTNATEGSEVCGLPEGNSTPCKSTVLPNAVVYSDSGSFKGIWVLKTSSDKVHDMLEQLENVPVDQKVAWLQNAGAHFDADPVDDIQMISKK